MSEFTEGKWVKRGNEIGVRDESDTQSYGMMQIVARVDEWDFKESYEANAHLIAAAPEMYEALKAFASNSSAQANMPYECEIAEKVLAKAEGK